VRAAIDGAANILRVILWIAWRGKYVLTTAATIRLLTQQRPPDVGMATGFDQSPAVGNRKLNGRSNLFVGMRFHFWLPFIARPDSTFILASYDRIAIMREPEVGLRESA
jgi:hypothetical protein